MGGFFERAENLLLSLIDQIYARLPRPNPGIERLKDCRIISHRGEHDGRRVFENTLAAFDAAVDHGVWGIEFDIRWTRDLEPVVTHDPDLGRVFGRSLRVGDSRLHELRRQCPHVPTLAEVIGRFGGRVHLMAEIKPEPYPDLVRQNRILADLFAGLCPGRDFHLLALSPETFQLTPFAPPSAFLPVALVNVSEFSRIALQRGYAGIAGHYMMMQTRVIERHHAAGQKAGTGYIGSRNALWREINRGVDWIFSNHAAEVQALLMRL
ncbi:MAG: glycerophosphodiester phosphodiesterase [Hyphomicrobiales bacterium]